MMKAILGLFGPMKYHRDFFNKHTNTIRHFEWLALDYNPEPEKSFSDHINYKNSDLDEKLSLQVQRTHALLSINGHTHEYTNIATVLFKYLGHKDLIILSAIEAFKKKLENLTPEKMPGEEKAIEWFRVSMEVVKRSLMDFDSSESELQYKLFYGKKPNTDSEEVVTIFRFIYFNLDILFEVSDHFYYQVIDKKSGIPGEEKVQKGIIKGVYNDFFNHIIEVLSLIKSLEKKNVF